MNYVDKTQEIKKALLQGGLVISDRNTGKTRALSEILLEDADAVVLVPNKGTFERLENYLLAGGMTKNEVRNRVFLDPKRLYGLNKNIYVDEYTLFSERPFWGSFKSATASFAIPVKVI